MENSTLIYHQSWFKYIVLPATIIALIIWAIYPRTIKAKIENISWTYQVQIEKREILHDSGFYPGNGAFNIVQNGTRIHHYNHITAGYHNESYTETYSCGQTCTTSPRVCSGTKIKRCSGGTTSCITKHCTRIAYHSVPTYIDVPVLENYYSWDYYQWKNSRVENNYGNDYEPKKPELTLNAQEERATDKISFKVILKDSKGKSFEYIPKDLNEFRMFKVGDVKIVNDSLTGVSIEG